jgi:hypothetical protein
MKKLFSVLIIFLVIWAAARPQSVTRLAPEAPEGHFEMGREYISLSNNQIQVELGFDGIFEEFLVFDAVVLNLSGQSLSIDPSDFYYILLDNPDADSSVLPPFAAVNPERIIHQYDNIHDARLSFASVFLATENPVYMNQIAVEKEVVRQEILRKCEIPSGKVQSGYLFFPEFEENGYIMICIPLEDQVFQFVYNKTREQV